MRSYLDFEKPIAEVDQRLLEAREAVDAGRVKAAIEVSRLEARLERVIAQTYRKLTPWQRVQLARHPDRPAPLAWARALAGDGIALGAGGEAVYPQQLTTLARPGGYSSLVVATDAPGGAPALPLSRLIGLAERWRLPLVRFIPSGETVAATLSAESLSAEVLSAEAAAAEVRASVAASAVIVAVIVGAVSGFHPVAALAADHVLMMDYAVWSVVAPEAAAIGLWHDDGQSRGAAEALKLTAADLAGFGIVDTVVAEPPGGAHREPATAAAALGEALAAALAGLVDLPPAALRRRRLDRLRRGPKAPAAG